MSSRIQQSALRTQTAGFDFDVVTDTPVKRPPAAKAGPASDTLRPKPEAAKPAAG